MSKLYILVRGDLSKSQQAVQACHAVAEFMLWSNEISCRCGQCTPDKLWENNTIVLLKVKNLEELYYWRDLISKQGQAYSEFNEPDMGNQMTAIAAWGYGLEDLLKNLSLL